MYLASTGITVVKLPLSLDRHYSSKAKTRARFYHLITRVSIIYHLCYAMYDMACVSADTHARGCYTCVSHTNMHFCGRTETM
jgi:hypothetical protein